MKLKYQFVVKTVSGKPIAVAVGTDNERFNGMIKLNSSGELIFKMLAEGDVTLEQILSSFTAAFGVTEQEARPAVLGFLDHLRQNELLAE